MKYIKLFESFLMPDRTCKIEKVDKSFLGHKYQRDKKIPHKWDLIKIGKFSPTDSEGTNFMVKFKCSECGKEDEHHFAEESNLLEIGVPQEIIDKYRDKSYEYSLRFADWYTGELKTPIPTTYQEGMNLY